jgi:hypothetical protein
MGTQRRKKARQPHGSHEIAAIQPAELPIREKRAPISVGAFGAVALQARNTTFPPDSWMRRIERTGAIQLLSRVARVFSVNLFQGEELDTLVGAYRK